MSKRNFSESELNIIKFWDDNSIFKKSVLREPKNKTQSGGDYVFYDGPPFATGLPHYGHILTSVMKDVIPRYFTMKGFRVERKWGWDCHGLPIENLIEQDLGLKSKKDIEELGIDKFNQACRSKVLMYADEWKKVISRLGRFVDMENDYKTMDLNFMESVWWVFKSLWDKKLIYKDYKSMHICPRCETTLSQSEVTEGYKDVKDLSVVAKFELIEKQKDENEIKTFILAWTTTPWTLPGNVALAVGENIDYVKIKIPQNPKQNKSEVVVYEYENIILAKEIFEKAKNKEYFLYESIGVNFDNNVLNNLSNNSVVLKEFKGSELVGKKYKPLFSYFQNDNSIKNIQNSYQIVTADFVTTQDGTGVVHIAPAFGQDDMDLAKLKDLPFVQHVLLDGRVIQKVTDFAGLEVKPKNDPTSTDIEIIKYLAKNNLLFVKQKYEHSYPHCWRCDSPLLNYATTSWFVKVTAIKDELLESAKQINWMPTHIKEGRFGQWLSGARDWAISRQRYWGSVMPVWECVCGKVQVFGSIEELQKASNVKLNDLHKDIVDKITVPCECGKKAKRIPDVLDCWFESGSMPYAQIHYPFKNKEKFENEFPAMFIAEGVDQTRAWFYYLHVLGVALMQKPAFQNVIVNGIVLAEDGKKMSKRLKNYPDPMYIMQKYGSDAMRLYLMTSPVVLADDLRFSEKGVDEVFKKVIMIWWNVFSFYEMYKDDSLLDFELKQKNILDEWVLSRLGIFEKEVSDNLNKYDLMKSSRLFVDFINDVSTWYLRRSRDRFKPTSSDSTSEEVHNKASALQTLRQVLIDASKIMAPFIPFLTEEIYQQIKNQNEPESIHLCFWPEFNFSINQEILQQMKSAREIVELALSLRSTNGIKIRQALSQMQICIKGQKPNNEIIELLKDELNIKNIIFVEELQQDDFWLKTSGFGFDIAINSEITEELKFEGVARELIRFINLCRKQNGFTITDKANLKFFTESQEIKDTFLKMQNIILEGTQCLQIQDIQQKTDILNNEIKINDDIVWLNLEKI